jgi:WD40 repeat protein
VGDGVSRLKLNEHLGAVRTVAFSPDGRYLATAGDDRRVVLVELATGKKAAEFVGHSYSVRSIAFTPDSTLLVSSAAAPIDKPGELMIWEVETQIARRRLQGPLGEVFAVAVDPLGRYIATAHRNGTVAILRAANRPSVQRPATD